ncbi:hypothetical protein K466DRAFT_663380 [Polyporus arcularius HHB13444]|uniref:Uncharacterized protein n=1 Tax=Polyporus arcularius HHB13444 TaxID=1314778 RepID=A0A5C3PBE9_9APHY|nr:hypothetical protein K466DRAFT_663380 [Polyporus arcularius HHB13444]
MLQRTPSVTSNTSTGTVHITEDEREQTFTQMLTREPTVTLEEIERNFAILTAMEAANPKPAALRRGGTLEFQAMMRQLDFDQDLERDEDPKSEVENIYRAPGPAPSLMEQSVESTELQPAYDPFCFGVLPGPEPVFPSASSQSYDPEPIDWMAQGMLAQPDWWSTVPGIEMLGLTPSLNPISREQTLEPAEPPSAYGLGLEFLAHPSHVSPGTPSQDWDARPLLSAAPGWGEMTQADACSAVTSRDERDGIDSGPSGADLPPAEPTQPQVNLQISPDEPVDTSSSALSPHRKAPSKRTRRHIEVPEVGPVRRSKRLASKPYSK